MPGGAQAADHGTRQKRPEGLAEPRGGRVLRGGNPHVMPPVVLHVKMPVEHRRQRHLGQPLFHPVRLVAQLMGGVDGDAGGAAGGDRQAQIAVPGQPPGGRHPGGVEKAGVEQRHGHVHRPAVVAVALQFRHGFLRRIGGFLAKQHVEQGDHAEHEQKAEPPHHRPAGEQHHLHGAHRQQHGENTEQPPVATAVAPVAVPVVEGRGIHVVLLLDRTPFNS